MESLSLIQIKISHYFNIPDNSTSISSNPPIPVLIFPDTHIIQKLETYGDERFAPSLPIMLVPIGHWPSWSTAMGVNLGEFHSPDYFHYYLT